MRRVLTMLAATAAALLAMGPAQSATPNVNAEHQTTAFDDCRFSSWYSVTQPLSAAGRLASVADARCSESHQIGLDLVVTLGEGDPAAAAGPPPGLVGVTGPDPAGAVVYSDHTAVISSSAQLASQVPAPPAGAVYTVDAVMKFSDGCANFGCTPPPPSAPRAPAMPGSVAVGSGGVDSQLTMPTCQPQHDGTFDVDCEWQFTVVGRALPSG